MNERYLIVENKFHEELIYKIVDFLWDNGNEVIVENHFFDKEYYQSFLDNNPCVITIADNDFSATENKMRYNLFPNDKMIFQFSSTGVYTNLIPFPHKIFEFNALTELQLNNFFEWCMKLNLFSTGKYKRNIFLPKKHTD